MSITLYTADHNRYLPYTDRDNVDWDAMMLGGGGGKVYALGSLAKGGYVDEPSLLFCPAYVRPEAGKYNVDNHFYDQPKKLAAWKQQKSLPWSTGTIWPGHISPDRWQEILSGKVHHAYSGLAAHSQGWISGRTQNHRTWGSQLVWQELTLADIAKHYDEPGAYGGISPALVSCGDVPIHAWAPREGKSHERRGVNAGFFDGSTRWISAEEHGHNYAAHRIYYAHTPFLKWARGHLRLTD
jgi:hypothetical protein